MRLHALQNIELGFFAEPRQGAQSAVARRAVKLLRRLHVEILVQALHPLRPQPGNVQQIGDARGQLALEFFVQRAGPAGGDFPHLRGQIRTDAGQLGHLASRGEARSQIDLLPFDHARGIAVGADAERIGLRYLQQIGDFAEHPCDVGVVHGGRWHVWSPAKAQAHISMSAPGACPWGGSSCSSATMQSVVRINPAIEAAFCSAERVTLHGSSTPIPTMSPNTPVAAL